MKIVIDEKAYKRKALFGRVALFGSLAILLGGLLLTLFGQQIGLLNPENSTLFFVIYLLILIVGFAVSRVGFFLGNRYLSPTRPDAVLRDALRGLDRKYALMLFKGLTNYLLVEPGGLTVFVVRGQEGKTAFQGGRWKRKESFFRFWFGRDEPLGNPSDDLNNEMAKVSKALAEKMPTLKVPVRGVIVFSSPKAILDIEPSPITILPATELKDYIRGAGKLKELPNSIQRKMRDAVGAPELPKAEQPA